MDLVTAKKLRGNLNMAMMLGSWKHVCTGHLPGAPLDKSKFLYAGADYLKIIALLMQALKQNTGATVNIYKDSQDSTVAVVIGTFTTPVGKSSGNANAVDCYHIACILMADGGNAQKTIFKSAYPIQTINTTRFTLLGAA